MSDGSERGKSGPKPTNRPLPVFDPGPSADFASRVILETGVDAAVIGRLAVWAWVEDESEHEFTKDLDMATSREDNISIRDWLARQGFRTRNLSIGGINLHYPESHVNLDFIDRSDESLGDLGALFRDAVQEALKRGYTVTIGRSELPLAPAEHVVVMKLATGEDKDERDAERLLLNVPGLDVEEVRSLIARFARGLTGRLDAILRRIGHPSARKRKRYNGDG